MPASQHFAWTCQCGNANQWSQDKCTKCNKHWNSQKRSATPKRSRSSNGGKPQPEAKPEAKSNEKPWTGTAMCASSWDYRGAPYVPVATPQAAAQSQLYIDPVRIGTTGYKEHMDKLRNMIRDGFTKYRLQHAMAHSISEMAEVRTEIGIIRRLMINTKAPQDQLLETATQIKTITEALDIARAKKEEMTDLMARTDITISCLETEIAALKESRQQLEAAQEAPPVEREYEAADDPYNGAGGAWDGPQPDTPGSKEWREDRARMADQVAEDMGKEMERQVQQRIAPLEAKMCEMMGLLQAMAQQHAPAGPAPAPRASTPTHTPRGTRRPSTGPHSAGPARRARTNGDSRSSRSRSGPGTPESASRYEYEGDSQFGPNGTPRAPDVTAREPTPPPGAHAAPGVPPPPPPPRPAGAGGGPERRRMSGKTPAAR